MSRDHSGRIKGKRLVVPDLNGRTSIAIASDFHRTRPPGRGWNALSTDLALSDVPNVLMKRQCQPRPVCPILQDAKLTANRDQAFVERLSDNRGCLWPSGLSGIDESFAEGRGTVVSGEKMPAFRDVQPNEGRCGDQPKALSRKRVPRRPFRPAQSCPPLERPQCPPKRLRVH